ncbi:MAG: hypothetical protein HYY26_06345 [Acidobacteria bacterium]|nr:hypothetical protein [Acidobacteriota bacterium]
MRLAFSLLQLAVLLGAALMPLRAENEPAAPVTPATEAEPTPEPQVAPPTPATPPTQPYVQRGTIARQKKAWVEELTCGAPVREGGRLVVRASMGRVTVKPGTGDRVECRVRLEAYTADEAAARRFLSSYELSLRPLNGGGVQLSGQFPYLRPAGVSIEVRVPRRFTLDLETGGGPITVHQLEGELRAVTAAGDIRAGEVKGPVRVETAGGCITLGNIGGRTEARTAGGSIHVGNVEGEAVLETSGGEIVTGRIRGSVRAATAGGDVLIGGADADVVTQTAGGSIRIGEAGGSVRAETAGGSIRLEAARGPVRVQTAGGSIDVFQILSGVEAVTVAGRIQALIAASRDSFRASRLETSFGDVEVYLPPDLPLTVDAQIVQASGHIISADFPLQLKTDRSGYGPGTVEGRGELNGGGELLRIRTVAGNILIRRLEPGLRQRLEERQKWLKEQWKKHRETRPKHEEEFEQEKE